MSESVDREGGADMIVDSGVVNPVKSIEGWIVLVTGVHEEAQEEDVRDVFENYGTVSSVHLNLDRRSGYVKGYALLEYKSREEAQSAIDNLNGTELLGKAISVSWVFRETPKG
ncbi:RNA recognition motif domain containing protein [Theileria equi strain WA]|uniref:RNA recognition motif domain containing protein n=1 Tax=Theileria equi strain WA TaxID=1537102 RepID=L1LDD7_THEEQ|nr:RNA recognition motif domain containing protein [Theileria equi strain WA]EKX73274.1 RNA recognition motif domain containing protein [Theileria equi strain WA]|eukprot:XP_004832726.1 RNA recognition motif domain containing protein [Theileria equi strain WA]